MNWFKDKMESISGSIIGSMSGASSIYTDNTSILQNPNYESLTNIVVDDYRPLKPYEFNLTIPSMVDFRLYSEKV